MHSHRAAGRHEGTPLRVAVAMVAAVGVITLAAMVWLWPTSTPTTGLETGSAEQFDATVVEIQRETCPEELPDDVNGCGTVQLSMDEPEGEKALEAPLPNGAGAPTVQVGDHVVVVSGSTPDGEVLTIVDHQRSTGLWVVAGAFVLALLAFGRWRGFTALLGLGVTFAVLLAFIVPGILAGESPVLMAMVGASAIMVTVLYLTHGFTASTTVAVLGTVISLILTGLLSWAAVAGLHLTGVTDDLSTAVGLQQQQVNTQGLLLAGIVIGSLGVLDDVTVTQAATVTELARANPRYSPRQVYLAATRVGRSHIASVVNTIILAYAGTSLPLLILIVANDGTLGGMLTTQALSQEIVRSAVATLGLIAAVPVTTALAAVLTTRMSEVSGCDPE